MNSATNPACDCHAHIFGSRDHYPLAPGADYSPDAATLSDYRAMLAALNLERCVLVQPSIYGTDNRCLLDALKMLGPHARGIAVIEQNAGYESLLEMHRLGIRGVRLNTLSSRETCLDELGDLERLIHPLGWHIQILLRRENRLAAFARIEQTCATVVLDHFASFSPDASSRELAALFELATKKNIWIKLSAPYLFSDCSTQDLLYYRQFTEQALSLMPDRLLLATDWPHPALKDKTITTAHLRALLIDWIPEELRHQITVENPQKLYGF